MKNQNPNTIQYRPYTMKELAQLYGVDPRTIKVWLAPFEEELGPKLGRYYTIPQVKKIFEKLDFPSIKDAA